jgi:hypothetical protein
VRKRKREESKEVMKKAYFLPIACVLVLTIASIPEALCYPPAGYDYMQSSATITVAITGMFTETLTAYGPVNISRSTPYDPGDGHMKIDTEIISMNLVGTSTHIGQITIIQSPFKASKGAVRQRTAGIDFPADSFFNVYIEILTMLSFPNNILHNNDPKNMSAIINQIPPYGSTYESPTTIPLQNAQNITIGALESTTHTIIHNVVGGLVIPVDKFSLLASYIALSSTILAATVATALYVKRIKKQ